MRPLIDNRMRATLDGMYPSRCTVATQTFTTNKANQKVPSGETAVAGLVNISCRIGPLIELRPTDKERRSSDANILVTARQCKLNGYFSTIKANAMVAQVDGVSYPIVGVEHDGNLHSTRLRLEIITP